MSTLSTHRVMSRIAPIWSTVALLICSLIISVLYPPSVVKFWRTRASACYDAVNDTLSEMFEDMRVSHSIDYNNNFLPTQAQNGSSKDATNSESTFDVVEQDMVAVDGSPVQDKLSEYNWNNHVDEDMEVPDDDVIFEKQEGISIVNDDVAFIKMLNHPEGHVEQRSQYYQPITIARQALEQSNLQKSVPHVIDLSETEDHSYDSSSLALPPPLYKLDSQALPDLVLDIDLMSYFCEDDSQDIADTFTDLFDVYGLETEDGNETNAIASLFELI